MRVYSFKKIAWKFYMALFCERVRNELRTHLSFPENIVQNVVNAPSYTDFKFLWQHFNCCRTRSTFSSVVEVEGHPSRGSSSSECRLFLNRTYHSKTLLRLKQSSSYAVFNNSNVFEPLFSQLETKFNCGTLLQRENCHAVTKIHLLQTNAADHWMRLQRWNLNSK